MLWKWLLRTCRTTFYADRCPLARSLARYFSLPRSAVDTASGVPGGRRFGESCSAQSLNHYSVPCAAPSLVCRHSTTNQPHQPTNPPTNTSTRSPTREQPAVAREAHATMAGFTIVVNTFRRNQCLEVALEHSLGQPTSIVVAWPDPEVIPPPAPFLKNC